MTAPVARRGNHYLVADDPRDPLSPAQVYDATTGTYLHSDPPSSALAILLRGYWEAYSGPLPAATATKDFPKTQKCKYCAAEATHRLLWAEGHAYVPVCDAHVARARHKIEVENHDEVIRDIPVKAVRHVRTPAGARRYGEDIGEIIRGWVPQPVSDVVGDYDHVVGTGHSHLADDFDVTYHEHEGGDVPHVGHGMPLLDDPTGDDMTSAKAPTDSELHDLFWRDVNDEFHTTVDEIKRQGDWRITVKGGIYADGYRVGQYSRILWPHQQLVEHSTMSLVDTYQGHGFATAFNAGNEEAYARWGYRRIEIHAGDEAGGIVWAKAGFKFVDDSLPPDIVDVLEAAVANEVFSTEDSISSTHRITYHLDREDIRATRRLLDYAQEDAVTPADVLALGELGAEVLRYCGWHGYKPVRELVGAKALPPDADVMQLYVHGTRETGAGTKVARHVRTPGGAELYDEPIGALIVPHPDVRVPSTHGSRPDALVGRTPAAAAAAAGLGDRLRIRGDGPVVDRHLERLAQVPPPVLERVATWMRGHPEGGYVWVTDGAITDLSPWAYVRGKRPRGWTSGTWDDVAGAGPTRVVPHVGLGAGIGGAYTSGDVALHEFGHAVEEACGGIYVVRSRPGWEHIRAELTSRNPNDYYNQAGGAGDEEVFAQSFEDWILGKTDDAGVDAWWRELLQLGDVVAPDGVSTRIAANALSPGETVRHPKTGLPVTVIGVREPKGYEGKPYLYFRDADGKRGLVRIPDWATELERAALGAPAPLVEPQTPPDEPPGSSPAGLAHPLVASPPKLGEIADVEQRAHVVKTVKRTAIALDKQADLEDGKTFKGGVAYRDPYDTERAKIEAGALDPATVGLQEFYTEDAAKLEDGKAAYLTALGPRLGFTDAETEEALRWAARMWQSWRTSGDLSPIRLEAHDAVEALRSGAEPTTPQMRGMLLQKAWTNAVWDLKYGDTPTIRLSRFVTGDYAARLDAALAARGDDDWSVEEWPLTSWAVENAADAVQRRWIGRDTYAARLDREVTRDDVWLLLWGEAAFRTRELKAPGEVVPYGERLTPSNVRVTMHVPERGPRWYARDEHAHRPREARAMIEAAQRYPQASLDDIAGAIFLASQGSGLAIKKLLDPDYDWDQVHVPTPLGAKPSYLKDEEWAQRVAEADATWERLGDVIAMVHRRGWSQYQMAWVQNQLSNYAYSAGAIAAMRNGWQEAAFMSHEIGQARGLEKMGETYTGGQYGYYRLTPEDVALKLADREQWLDDSRARALAVGDSLGIELGPILDDMLQRQLDATRDKPPTTWHRAYRVTDEPVAA